MSKRTYTLFYRSPPVTWSVRIGAVLLALLLAIAAMVWSTAGLERALARSTEDYVSDVSYQLTADISSRIEAFERSLELLANSVPNLPGENALLTFLQAQAQTLGFDTLAVIGGDGDAVPSSFSARDLSGIRASFRGEDAVVFSEGQSLLFSVPIYENGAVERVLAGVRGKENMQELIRPRSYDGSGLTCIVDSTGSVVISPTDLKPFLQLDEIFQSGDDARASAAILEMESDLASRQPGAFQFTAVDGTRLVMSYHVLGVNDWFLLTLVPADLISGEANTFIFRSFLIVGGIVVVFALLIAALIQFFRASRRELERAAFTDPLTGGRNQAAFQMEYERLAPAMTPGSHTIVFLNVRGFKLINENFGTSMGNDTLRYLYQVLDQHVRAGEIAARGSADQFFLCLGESAQERVQARLDELTAAVNSFVQHTDIRYYLTILQGACIVDDPGLDLTILQDRARAACSLHDGKGPCRFYNEDMMRRMKREQELNALFADSIANHDFQVYLQPKIRLSDGALGGAEALVRWIHPRQGMIYPSDFIPVFERSEAVCVLDLYVFEQVCTLLDRWRGEGRVLPHVSFNLSRAHFRNLNFLRSYSAIKEKYRIPDGILEIELTESMFFDDQQRELVKNSIQEMHRLGFQCSLDDFGVGFSSLALLKDFDVDTIKLDRKFFEEVSSERAQEVIASFIALADRLGVATVAEGIETTEQLDVLRRMGCGMVQGYVFSKPLPVPEFEARAWTPDSLKSG